MKRLLVILAVLVLLPATVANAGTITVGNFTGPGVTIQSPFYNGPTTAGPVPLTFTAFTGTYSYLNNLTLMAYCADLQHSAGTGNDSAVAPMSGWNLYAYDANAGAKASWLFNNYSGGGTATAEGALQLAIWNVLYDTDLTVSTGNFAAVGTNAAIIALANTYLGTLGSHVADALWAQVSNQAVTGGGPIVDKQDFITNVPEPGSMLLLGTGLIGLAGAVRRRLRK